MLLFKHNFIFAMIFAALIAMIFAALIAMIFAALIADSSGFAVGRSFAAYNQRCRSF